MLTLVKMETDFCPLCRRLGALLSMMMLSYTTCNLSKEENQHLIKELNIQTVPTLIIREGDKELDRLEGMHTPQEVTSWLLKNNYVEKVAKS